MQTAIQLINYEYDNKLLEIRSGNNYDVLEMSESPLWWCVLVFGFDGKVKIKVPFSAREEYPPIIRNADNQLDKNFNLYA